MPLGPGWSLTKWLVYSISGRPASRHTLQKGVGARPEEEEDAFLEDDDIGIRLFVSGRTLLYV